MWKGGEVSGGGRWATGSGLYLSLKHKQYCCIFCRQQKQTKTTGYAEMVITSSLASHTSLLMLLNGSTSPVVHQRGSTGSAKSHLKADLAIYSHILSVPGWCVSIALYKLDFSSCDVQVSFANPVTIFFLTCTAHIANRLTEEK